MKTYNRSIRTAAMALAAVLVLSLALPYAALAAEQDTISIRSAADLVKLSQNCTLNTWSRGKTVVLEADIDLSGTDFAPIPTFGGVFEGGGHTISGLSLSQGDSYQGLFRYIQEGAVVRDLHVTGTVAAVGDQAYLGGIAGSNEGTILDCSFRGTVEGKSQVGGIAGSNEAAGSIYGCKAEGAVTGEKSTGGIAGQSSGTVTGCLNKSAVNTVHAEKEQTIDESLNSLSGEQKEDVLDTTTDTGGIAGFSNGVLRSCRNEGAVGYAHVGYNVGGVVGRSSGYLENCMNAGTVEGRKDVGGVAGQIAPNIRLIFSPDTIDELKDELDRLNRMVDDTLDHSDASRNTISDRLDQLSDYARTASGSADQLADVMSGWTDSTIDTINDACDTLADTLDRLEEITDNGEEILDTVADGMDLLEDSLDRMSGAMGTGQEGLDSLAGAMEDVREAVQQAQDGLDSFQRALRDLSRAIVVNDQEAIERALRLLQSGTQDLSDALRDCGEAVEELSQLLEEGGPSEEDLSNYLVACLYLLKDGFDAAADTADDLGRSLAAAMNSVEVNWDTVQESARRIAQALESFSSSCEAMDSSMRQLREAILSFSEVSGGMEDALTVLADAMDTFEGAFRDMGDVADDVHDLFDDLSSRDPIEFDKLGDDFHQAEDDLHSAVNGIGDQMDLLREEVNISGDTLSGDIRDLGDQFQVIADLILDAFSDARDLDEEDLWDDVSEERINGTTLGKVRGCVNLGAVEGDLNVGGITGAMAIEYDFDPEDDITEVGEESFDFRYETRAILQDCVNKGPVTSKKDAAGGAVGRMELGYVLNCENYGAVESTDGDYTGGIAGISKSTIRGCWSKCGLSGGSYVGGITGYGYEVYQCVSLVSIRESEGYAGSVAGDWGREDGTLLGNRFVEGRLAGVDGISYAGQAEPVAYAALMEEAGVPQPFRSMTVTYVVEDRVLETVSYAYGQALSAREVPAVPEKAGYFGVWEEVGENVITIDHVVEAVYTPYTTTLASAAMRDSVHPVFLVEGVFTGEAALREAQVSREDSKEQWTVTLAGTDADTFRVRFTPPGEWTDVSLFLLTEDGKEPIQWEREGSCCVFMVSSSHFTMEAARQSVPSSLLGAVLAACFAAAALCFLAIWKNRRKGPRRPVPPHDSSSPSDAKAHIAK